MNIRMTSVTCEETGPILQKVLVELEDGLSPFFREKSYGEITQFTAVMIAVDSDETENHKFGASHDRVGTYRHFLSNERIRYISFALYFDPFAIAQATEAELVRLICEKLVVRADRPGLKIPKTFEYQTFSEDLKLAVMIYSRASFTPTS